MKLRRVLSQNNAIFEYFKLRNSIYKTLPFKLILDLIKYMHI